MAKNPRDEYPNRLRELMAEAKLTQRQLADAVGVNQVTVGYWLSRGSVPYADNLHRLCAVLGVTPEWLVEGTGQRATARPSDVLSGLPVDILADLAILGEAAKRSTDARHMLGHLARTFKK